MSIKIKLDPNNAGQMQALSRLAEELAALAGGAAEVAPEKPAKPTKPVKKPKSPEPQEAPEPQAESETAENSEITLDDIRAMIAEKKDKHFDALKAKLVEGYGVPNVVKLPKEKFAEFYKYVSSL